MRSIQATHNLLAVSANTRETAINTEQTLDATMLCALGDIINLEPRRENNSNEATGKEEPDTIYDNGAIVGGNFNFEKAQPQHYAFLLAYALGSASVAAAGDGHKHTIVPIDGDLDTNRSVPSFTAAQRYGKTVLKRLFASMFVDQVTATFATDSWCKISGTIKGTGKKTDNVTSEDITAAKNVAALTLAANAMDGATAAARLASVQQIKVELDTGVFTEVAYSAASDATPAVITITPPCTPTAITGLSKAAACVVTKAGHGLASLDKVTFAGIEQAEWSVLNGEQTVTYIGPDTFSVAVNSSAFSLAYDAATDPGTIVESTTATYTVLYIPTEAGWMTFPARVNETPLRVAQLTVNVGGAWNGTAFVGGRTLQSEIKTLEWTFQNNLKVEFAPGAGGAYASRAIRDGRSQKIKLDKEFREFIMQQHISDNDTFGIYVLAEGALYDATKKYQVEIIFPSVGVIASPVSLDSKRLAESVDLQVLEHGTYGSVIVNVQNLQATYAA